MPVDFARVAAAAIRAFATPATYTPPGGEALSTSVILRGGSSDAPTLGRGRRSRAWTADIRADDVPQPQKGATLTVPPCVLLPEGGSFTVADFTVDRPGLVWRLDLDRNAAP